MWHQQPDGHREINHPSAERDYHDQQSESGYDQKGLRHISETPLIDRGCKCEG
jgi:hypothetical protein